MIMQSNLSVISDGFVKSSSEGFYFVVNKEKN